jgi:hypothetical protein
VESYSPQRNAQLPPLGRVVEVVVVGGLLVVVLAGGVVVEVELPTQVPWLLHVPACPPAVAHAVPDGEFTQVPPHESGCRQMPHEASVQPEKSAPQQVVPQPSVSPHCLPMHVGLHSGRMTPPMHPPLPSQVPVWPLLATQVVPCCKGSQPSPHVLYVSQLEHCTGEQPEPMQQPPPHVWASQAGLLFLTSNQKVSAVP